MKLSEKYRDAKQHLTPEQVRVIKLEIYELYVYIQLRKDKWEK